MSNYLKQNLSWLGMLYFCKQRVKRTFWLYLLLFYTKRKKDKLKEASVSGSMSPPSDGGQQWP